MTREHHETSWRNLRLVNYENIQTHREGVKKDENALHLGNPYHFFFCTLVCTRKY